MLITSRQTAQTAHLPAPHPLELTLPDHELAGVRVEELTLRGLRYGRPIGEAPVFVLMGGITAPPTAFGDGREPGWWSALARPELIDARRFTVLCPALLGNGSEWRAFAEAPRDQPLELPPVSVSDLADLVAIWLAGVGCEQPICFVGASLGGLIGLGLALRHPARVRELVSVSAGLGPDGWATGVRHLQREIVRDGLRHGELDRAMSRARQLGMLTYRGRGEINQRFELLRPGATQPSIASYLEHNGEKFARGFSPHGFLMLSESIDRCSFAESDGELRARLGQLRARVSVVGVPEDLLFPYDLQVALHEQLLAAGRRSRLHTLSSVYGHDAFLADQRALASLMHERGLLELAGTGARD